MKLEISRYLHICSARPFWNQHRFELLVYRGRLRVVNDIIKSFLSSFTA
jgi:hypothetical protein